MWLGLFIMSRLKEAKAGGLTSSMLVSVPVNTNLDELVGGFGTDFNAITNVQVWIVAFNDCLGSKFETLLCVEATDKLDEETHYA